MPLIIIGANVSVDSEGTVGSTTPTIGILVGESDGTNMQAVRHKYTQTDTGVTGNGALTAINMTAYPLSKFTVQSNRTAGANNCTIALQGTIDGTNWVTLGSDTSAGADMMFHVVSRPCLQVRANVTDVGAGNTLDVTVLASKN